MAVVVIVEVIVVISPDIVDLIRYLILSSRRNLPVLLFWYFLLPAI